MIAIHDPDVVFTDLGLAFLGTYFAARLWRLGPGFVTRHGAMVMQGLASAAFFGGIFHAFFPAKLATEAGAVAWLLVAFSIGFVAQSLLDLALWLLLQRSAPQMNQENTAGRVAIVTLYCTLFVYAMFAVDKSFSTIVVFYAPVVAVMLVAALREAARTRSRAWALISAGLVVSGAAAILQQLQVAIHPVYFDHNAVYHVIQALALVLLYLGFRARRADQAARA